MDRPEKRQGPGQLEGVAATAAAPGREGQAAPVQWGTQAWENSHTSQSGGQTRVLKTFTREQLKDAWTQEIEKGPGVFSGSPHLY